MVRVRTILTITIAIFAVNHGTSVVQVEAGKSMEVQLKHLPERDSMHNGLKSDEQVFRSKRSLMNKSVVKRLTSIPHSALKRILRKGKLVLGNTFLALRRFADEQIESRVEKLEKTYQEWEKKNSLKQA